MANLKIYKRDSKGRKYIENFEIELEDKKEDFIEKIKSEIQSIKSDVDNLKNETDTKKL